MAWCGFPGLTSLSLLCRMSLKPGSRFGCLLTSSNASLAAGMHACPPCHPPLPAIGKMPPMCSSSGLPATPPFRCGEAIKQSKNIQNVTAPSLVISCKKGPQSVSEWDSESLPGRGEHRIKRLKCDYRIGERTKYKSGNTNTNSNTNRIRNIRRTPQKTSPPAMAT